jgi:hypothetical protein
VKLVKASVFRVSKFFDADSQPDMKTVRRNVEKGIWPGTATPGCVWIDVDTLAARCAAPKVPKTKPFNPVYRR